MQTQNKDNSKTNPQLYVLFVSCDPYKKNIFDIFFNISFTIMLFQLKNKFFKNDYKIDILRKHQTIMIKKL